MYIRHLPEGSTVLLVAGGNLEELAEGSWERKLQRNSESVRHIGDIHGSLQRGVQSVVNKGKKTRLLVTSSEDEPGDGKSSPPPSDPSGPESGGGSPSEQHSDNNSDSESSSSTESDGLPWDALVAPILKVVTAVNFVLLGERNNLIPVPPTPGLPNDFLMNQAWLDVWASYMSHSVGGLASVASYFMVLTPVGTVSWFINILSNVIYKTGLMNWIIGRFPDNRDEYSSSGICYSTMQRLEDVCRAGITADSMQLWKGSRSND